MINEQHVLNNNIELRVRACSRIRLRCLLDVYVRILMHFQNVEKSSAPSKFFDNKNTLQCLLWRDSTFFIQKLIEYRLKIVSH